MIYWVTVEPNVNVYVNDLNPRGKNPILFLHGWPLSHQMFEYQYNTLLREGYRCIGMDMRGFGYSDKPLSGYGYSRLADDVQAVISALGLTGVTLVGHSTGGAIAIRYMARYGPAAVSRLCLMAAAAPSLIRRPTFPFGLQAGDVDAIIAQTLSDRPLMVSNFGKQVFYQPVTQPFLDWFCGLGMQASSTATAAVSYTWLNEVLFDDLPRIGVPALIMQGVHDEVVLYPLAVSLNEGIRSSRLVTFEESGHGLFYEQKEKCNDELLQFIG